MNNKNLIHNHPLDEKIYKNYSFVRNKQLQENTEAYYDLCKTLITANASTYNNRKLLNEKLDINPFETMRPTDGSHFAFRILISEYVLLKKWHIA
jgi:hypothetical protein